MYSVTYTYFAILRPKSELMHKKHTLIFTMLHCVLSENILVNKHKNLNTICKYTIALTIFGRLFVECIV